jgi:hypothetical protein
MTSRQVWTLNFGTTLSFLVLLIGRGFESINLNSSDKDIIVVYFLILIGLYLVLLSYLFYVRIYKAKNSKRPFYVLTALTVVLSFVVLFQVIAHVEVFEWWTIIILIVCGLNVITYFWGLVTNASRV